MRRAEGSSFFQENWNAKISLKLHTSKYLTTLCFYAKLKNRGIPLEISAKYHFLIYSVKLLFTNFALLNEYNKLFLPPKKRLIFQ